MLAVLLLLAFAVAASGWVLHDEEQRRHRTAHAAVRRPTIRVIPAVYDQDATVGHPQKQQA